MVATRTGSTLLGRAKAMPHLAFKPLRVVARDRYRTAKKQNPAGGIGEGTMKQLIRAVALMAAVTTGQGAHAQINSSAYPSRPITINVPYAAGGPLDVMVRVVADGLRGALGQTIVIENVAGAGGSIGVGRAVRAAPDGYTISAGNWSAHMANGAIYALSYDLLKDFEPVSQLPFEADLIIARKIFPPTRSAN